METELLNNQDIIKQLNKHIEQDFDAINAYDTAIERLNDQQCIVNLSNFKADHQREVQDLSDYVMSLQGKPAQSAKPTKMQQKVRIGY